jgi:hypothetical protein
MRHAQNMKMPEFPDGVTFFSVRRSITAAISHESAIATKSKW